MKKNDKRIVSVLSACFLLLAAMPVNAIWIPAENEILREESEIYLSVDATVKISENDIIRNADRHMLDICAEPGSPFNIVDSNDCSDGSCAITPQWKEFSKSFYKPKAVRYCGTPSIYLHWYNNIGPFENRKDSSSTRYDGYKQTVPAQSLGPVELANAFDCVNSDMEYVFVLNMSETPEDNANFARFLCDEKDESEWGAMRARYGREKPVKVMAFELGNELDVPYEQTIDNGMLDWYVERCKETILAIKEFLPDAKFMAIGKNNPSTIKTENRDDFSDTQIKNMNWRYWTIGIAKGLGDLIDYMTIHIYYTGWSTWQCLQFFDQYQEDYKSVTGHEIPLAITEHAAWSELGEGGGADVQALRGTLGTAEWINKTFKIDYIGMMSYFCANGGNNTYGMMWYDCDIITQRA